MNARDMSRDANALDRDPGISLGWSRSAFLTALVAGGLIRVAALALPGTADMGVWKIWTYNGAVHTPARLYGVGGSPTEWRVLEFSGAAGTVVYPPLALYELAAVGRLYRTAHLGAFPDTAGLTIAIKTLIIASEIGLLSLLFVAVRRQAGLEAATWAAAVYWLNPALILAGSMLGYLDPLYVLPAAGATFAAGNGWPFLSGALIAAAALTKPQAVVLIPGVMLALWPGRSWRAVAEGLAWFGMGAALVSGAIVAPIISVGGWPNLVLAMSRLAHHDMLSGNASNLWWIIGYILRVVYAVHDMGAWGAITMRTRILGIGRVMELGYPNPRMIGTALTLAAAAWALWTARRARHWFQAPAVGAFLMHAYATLAAQVHENHLYAAVPLLVIVAADRRRYRPLLWAVSAIFALNLNLFYGISEYAYRGRYTVSRSMTIIDLSVLLAIANCAALVWHAAVLKRECSVPPGAGEAPIAG
jgi:hypothetical protein